MFGYEDASRAGPALLEFRPESESVLAETAERRLRNSTYLALRNVTCLAQGEVVVLRGCLPTYYLKQMAQALVAQIDGVAQVVNEVDVISAPTGFARRG